MLYLLFLLAVFPRTTADSDADFLAALRRARLLETAEDYCDERLRAAERGSSGVARWSIALSAVRSERARIEPSDEAWQRAAAPCEVFLSGYGDAPHAPWVAFQLGLVAHGRAERLVLELRGAPGSAATREQALEHVRLTLARYNSVIDDVQQRIESAPAATSDAVPADVSQDDLRRLLVDGELQKVRMLLLRVACYASGSNDAFAAATEAHDSVQRLARSLAKTDPGWREMRVLEAETLLALARPDDALSNMKELSEAGPLDADEAAVAVRAAIAAGDVAAARALVAQAERSGRATPQFELAQLQLLLAGGQTAAALERVAEIERRYGGYWKRLAELALLEAGSAGSSEAPGLIAADATTLLQAGQSQAAQQRFFEAADAALRGRLPEDAVRYALLATAAARQHGAGGEAAGRLATAAVAAAEAEMASGAHLLAIQLRAGAADGAADFEPLLRQHLDHWPRSGEAAQVRGWLDEVLAATGRYDQRLQMWLDAVQRNPADVDAGVRVRDAAVDAVVLSDASTASWESVGERVREMAGAIRKDAAAAPLLAATSARLGALFSPHLPGPPAPQLEATDPFAFHLAQVRFSGQKSAALSEAAEAVGDAELGAAFERLVADARSANGSRTAQLAEAAVTLAERMEEGPQRTRRVAHALVLARREAEARQRVSAAEPAERLPLMASLAEAFLQRGDEASLEAALEYWNSVAAKTAKGSDLWAQAKLGAAKALVQLQRTDEAVALLRYALLIARPQDADQAKAMEQFVERHDRDPP